MTAVGRLQEDWHLMKFGMKLYLFMKEPIPCAGKTILGCFRQYETIPGTFSCCQREAPKKIFIIQNWVLPENRRKMVEGTTPSILCSHKTLPLELAHKQTHTTIRGNHREKSWWRKEGRNEWKGMDNSLPEYRSSFSAQPPLDAVPPPPPYPFVILDPLRIIQGGWPVNRGMAQ